MAALDEKSRHWGAVFLCMSIVNPIATADAATIKIQSRVEKQPPYVFVAGDGKLFRQTTAFLTKATISFRSDGGDLLAGLSIGEAIRLKGFTTIVEGTFRCASACALAWLGGTRRFMSPQARIGFHAAYNKDGQETGVGNALIGAYLNKIGLPYAAVVYITQAAPRSMTWLDVSEAEKLEIDVEQIGSAGTPGERMAAAPPAAPVPAQRPGSVERKKTAEITTLPHGAGRPSLRASDIIGPWGLASYRRDADRQRAETAARTTCSYPFMIARSAATGDVRMLNHDNPQMLDMRIKASADGRTFIGAAPIAGDPDDREIVSFDGRVMVLKWVDPAIVAKYGIMVLVRCVA